MLPLLSTVWAALVAVLLFQWPPTRAQFLDDALLQQLGLAGIPIEPGLTSAGPAVGVTFSTTSSQPTSRPPSSVPPVSATFSPLPTSVPPSAAPSLSAQPFTTTTRSASITVVTSKSQQPIVVTAPLSTTSTARAKRAVVQCLKSVEDSCTNLASNCLDSVNNGNRNNLWGIRSCVLAATCYGVGDLISSIRCQTGFTITNADQGSLDYNIYALAVGGCAWAAGGCPVTQQNYIDWYYSTLSLINTSVWPSSVNTVIGYWSAIKAWTATGDTIPYLNLNDWYHFSSFPVVTTTTSTNVTTTATTTTATTNAPVSPGVTTTTTTKVTTTATTSAPASPGVTTGTTTKVTTTATTSAPVSPGVTTTTTTNAPAVPVYTPVAWNPNPIPPSTAVSQTFVASGTTVVIPKPVTTTITVAVAGSTLTLAPGGQVVGPIPTGVSQPEAVPPVWNNNPIIPTTTGSATFISGTWTSIVAVPTSTATPVTVDGPPDDGDDDDSNDSWLLVLLALLAGGGVGAAGGGVGAAAGIVSAIGIVGAVPASVTVIGAMLPAPVPPPGWPEDGSWVPPVVPPPAGGSGGNGPTGPDPDDPNDDDGPDNPDVCYWTLPPFDSPYDGESGPDPDEDEDEDETFVRRTVDYGNYGNSTNATTTFSHLFRRAKPRAIKLGPCNDVEQKNPRGLTTATYYSINNPAVSPVVASANTALFTVANAGHKPHDGRVKEHLFEFRYFMDFIQEEFPNPDCTWLRNNAWNIDPNGNGPLKTQIINTIDQTQNMVWADRALNRAKSYVANDDSDDPAKPPLYKEISKIANLQPGDPGSRKLADDVQTLIRAFGGLAQYFNLNAVENRNTGGRVQNLLALVTPSTPIYPPLDTRFNNFLVRTFATYTDRKTTRGINMLNNFIGRLDSLLSAAQNTVPPPAVPPVVPQCWPVYHDPGIFGRILGSVVNAGNLVPAPIPHPPCNTAGTTGSFVLFYDAMNGNPVTYAGDPPHQVEATGTQHYLLRKLGRAYTSTDLAPVYGPQCTGIVWLDAPSALGSPRTKWGMDCPNGPAGPALARLYPVDVNGNRLTCLFNNHNDGTYAFEIDCGPSQAAVLACINHMNARSAATRNWYPSLSDIRLQA